MKISFSKLSTIFLSLFLAIATVYLIARPGANILVSAPINATTKAEVIDVDDSSVEDLGAVRYGTQRLRVSLPDGREFNAENELRAQMELDKMFQPGDKIVVELPKTLNENTVLFARD